MKFYRVEYGEPNEDPAVIFCKTKREAQIEARSIKQGHEGSGVELEIDIVTIDVPTDRDGLFAWVCSNSRVAG